MMPYKFKLGQSVWVKTDVDQHEHIVSGYLIRPGAIEYLCKLGDREGPFYDFELTNEIDQVKKVV